MKKISPEDPSKVVIVHHPPQPDTTTQQTQAKSLTPPLPPQDKPVAEPAPKPKRIAKKPEQDAKATLKEKTVR